jgi:uncharacterized protein
VKSRSRLAFFLILVPLLLSAKPVEGSARDNNHNGYPDVAELHSSSERENFLRWFAAIAESQYTAINADWKLQDCSGLLRYAYLEALKPKTKAWWSRFKYFPDRQIAPLQTLSYPLPVLGETPFRTQGGSFSARDVQNKIFQENVSAGFLMRYATVPLGFDVSKAKRGDLLFFLHPLAQGAAYHSMVYLGAGRVVYHTGLSPVEGGEVRLLSLQTLMKHPDPSWHPIQKNSRFLGFFRWKMVSN